ncbi:tripartite tricarboxylate transporter substrate-binding protein [Sabulicella glaciei]|uniref:Tripartite tricarboxylate transporter substrate-binding protein n=1 Tax=Sabulicella glaciei TaxID=2984948 RepID=A0ABT3NZN5_9PROT|nr:tripartite tricarboxylate transporter substrate-binding protein [Roseococcus sp. MDT2-1-1]MCW8087625.1 tripartite tricarboxylate transporter substrate-binding protein [Roseococcus sp. MDT2-1-1]
MLRRHALALLGAPALLPSRVSAQFSRPIRIVVPFPPGGSNDVVARPLADRLQARIGQPVVIENRAGAGGSIGAGQVAQAPADGTTLMITSSSFAASAVVQRTPYDAQTSFDPVSVLARAPFFILTNPNFPPRDVGALIEYAKANPGKVDFGSSGPGGINHFISELFALRAGIRLNHVPYRGMPPAVTDLVAGHIQMLITTMASASAPVRENRVRLLAYTAPGAPPGSPPAPTVREVTGLDYDAAIWWGLFAPRGTPREVVRALNEATRAALAEPELARIYEAEGARPAPSSPEEFAATLAADIARFREVAQAANIRLD